MMYELDMENPKEMERYASISLWLISSVTECEDKQYRHRLLRENPMQRREALEELRSIVFQAHEDARCRYRRISGIALHPSDGASTGIDPSIGYPELLHMQTLKGYLGEIFAGIVAELFSPFESNWEVPAYLFRDHLVEFQQLEAIRQIGKEADVRPGRTGDDCLAFNRDSHGRITKVLYCEAKCTPDHEAGMIAQAHAKVGRAPIVDLPQLIEILMDKDDPSAREWVNALRQLWFSILRNRSDYERRDLVSYVCGKFPIRKTTWIPTNKPHNAYCGERWLEAVECHVGSVEELVREVYNKKAQ